jgi:hypothetical protein
MKSYVVLVGLLLGCAALAGSTGVEPAARQTSVPTGAGFQRIARGAESGCKVVVHPGRSPKSVMQIPKSLRYLERLEFK